jgi:hypothetical protein
MKSRNIMQTTVEKFKKRERELLDELQEMKMEFSTRSNKQVTPVL